MLPGDSLHLLKGHFKTKRRVKRARQQLILAVSLRVSNSLSCSLIIVKPWKVQPRIQGRVFLVHYWFKVQAVSHWVTAWIVFVGFEFIVVTIIAMIDNLFVWAKYLHLDSLNCCIKELLWSFIDRLFKKISWVSYRIKWIITFIFVNHMFIWIGNFLFSRLHKFGHVLLKSHWLLNILKLLLKWIVIVWLSLLSLEVLLLCIW